MEKSLIDLNVSGFLDVLRKADFTSREKWCSDHNHGLLGNSPCHKTYPDKVFSKRGQIWLKEKNGWELKGKGKGIKGRV